MITPEEVTRIRRFLLEKEEKMRQAGELAKGQVIARLKEALQEVAPLFPVERVYLYGSTSSGRRRPDSDLDLAVEGALAPGELFNLWCELDRLMEQEIDLREMAGLPFREKVQREGILLYERKNPSSY